MKLDRRSVLIGAASYVAAWAAPAAASDSAGEIVARERQLARADGRGVLISFYASWCAWCTPMMAVLEDPPVRRVIEPRFRMLHVRALERREEQRALQLPGADELFLTFAHPSVGLPFLAFIDGEGRVTASSFAGPNGENIGFPVGAADLAAFDAMIARAAPNVTARERAAVRRACVYAVRR